MRVLRGVSLLGFKECPYSGQGAALARRVGHGHACRFASAGRADWISYATYETPTRLSKAGGPTCRLNSFLPLVKRPSMLNLLGAARGIKPSASGQ
jgi:hypothetical protein